MTADDTVRALLARHGGTLLALAAHSIRHTLANGAALAVDLSAYPPELSAHGASFVTLRRNKELRGCIGSARAWRPLVIDVAGNAAASAFEDPRFKPLAASELPSLWLSISVLTPPEAMAVASDAEFQSQIRPGQDGLILSDGPRSAVLLPQVWEMLPDKAAFVAALKEKAGLPRDHWSPETKALRFGSVTIAGENLFDTRR
jgi:AmmeMemoRadiSam system protein A